MGARIDGTGLVIRSLPRGGPLFEAGLRPKDRVIAVNGRPVADELDFLYLCARDFFEIGIERGGRFGTAEIERPAGTPVTAEFYGKPVNICRNRCIFCFIDQMPKGLRRSLYVKDEDLSHSFLNGNYVTLTSASKRDLKRAVSIGLSPLFVSVHATDFGVRAAMLGNRRIPDIRGQLSYLSGGGVAFHAQIVLCPGINDGKILEKTVEELFGYGKSLLSIAVVPVGITRFNKKPLTPVDGPIAAEVCRAMGEMSDRMKRMDGVRKLFVADEMFIKAGLSIPSASYYEEYPQIENGVGLVRRLLREGAGLKRRRPPADGGSKRTHVLVITGRSALPYLKRALADAETLLNKSFDVRPVTNRWFGETVTVAGLLSARDVIREIRKLSAGAEYAEVILPGAMFNRAGHTLDGYSAARIGRSVGLRVRGAGSLAEI